MRKEHSGLSTPKLAALLTKSAAAGYLTQKNDLSSPAIGNPPKTFIPKSGSNNAQQCYINKHRLSVSLWDTIGLFFVAQKGADK